MFKIPTPTLCPDERQRKRLAWRNEGKLFSRTCDATGSRIVSEYPSGTPFPVFALEYFFEREWPVPEREFDFQRPFFAQFRKLLCKVPRAACLTDLRSLENNSTFQNASSRNQNCYLVFATGDCQDCQYGNSFDYCKNCLDGFFLRNSSWCYECIDCLDGYQLFFAQDAFGCSESAFLLDCRNCHHCFGCVGLRNRSYCLFNQQLSREEFTAQSKALLAEINSHSGVLKQTSAFNAFAAAFPRRCARIEQSEQASGDLIYQSKNIASGFSVYDCEDCRHITKFVKGKDCIDVTDWGDPGELLRECITVGKNAYNLFACTNCWPECHNLLYCDSCANCSDLFGCIGLYRKQYCILNKQYSKEEYEEQVPRIIEHMRQTEEWGEFFPVELSPFAYNETMAQEYFPLSREEVLQKGWQWRDETKDIPQVEKIIPANLLPDSISDIPDDILNWAIECEESKQPFIIQQPELEFYRKMNLPIPRMHPDVRHAKRMAKRNPRKLWNRSCDNCGKGIETTYAPERPEKVFCDRCYQQTVY